MSVLDRHPMADAMLALRLRGKTVPAIAEQFGVNENTLAKWLRPLVAQARTTGTDDAEEVLAQAAADETPVPGTPVDTFREAFGMEPMPHQVELLMETRDTLLLKGRQIGASHAASSLALHVALANPYSLSLILTPSARQSSEIALRARQGLYSLGAKLRQDSVTVLRLANGSRIVAVGGGKAQAVRGYSVTGGGILVLDECSFIQDESIHAARAVAATGSRTIMLSTPGRPVGEFWRLATQVDDDHWYRMKVTSEEVPTIDPAFLERERRDLPPETYAQEYLCQFRDDRASGVKLWTADQWQALLVPAPDEA